MYAFKLPDLGEGIVESEITTWHVAVGDVVAEDQLLAEVQTDKAIVELTSPVNGKVIALGCEAGELLAVGADLVRFELTGTAKADQNDAADKQLGTDQPQSSNAGSGLDQGGTMRAHTAPSADPAFAAVLASPSLRKRAREQGIDLASVPGSGPGGRIYHSDFEAFVATGGELAVKPVRGARKEGTTEVKISGLRRVIAQKMQEAKRNIPHYSYIEEVDVTQVEELRAHLMEEKEPEQPKLTLLPFLIQAMVRVLPRFPHCNARFEDTAGVLTQLDAVHIGLATMTERGLMVPVVRHCESLNLWQTAEAIARASAAAREGKAAPADLTGSTITITSLGAIGGIATTPVINAPETAIVGVNKMQERAVVRGGDIVVRKMMNLSASFDHRIVDGYDGAQFIQALKTKLENPGAVFV